MKTGTIPIRRKLLFDIFDPERGKTFPEESPEFEQKLESIKQSGVAGIFIVSSRVADSYLYLRFLKAFERKGFHVKSVYLRDLDESIIDYIERVIGDMEACFTRGSCMLVSYGESRALLLMACYLLAAGKTVSEALQRVRIISPKALTEREDLSFLNAFERHLRADVGPLAAPGSVPHEGKEPGEPEQASPVSLDELVEEPAAPAVAAEEPLPQTEKIPEVSYGHEEEGLEPALPETTADTISEAPVSAPAPELHEEEPVPAPEAAPETAEEAKPVEQPAASVLPAAAETVTSAEETAEEKPVSAKKPRCRKAAQLPPVDYETMGAKRIFTSLRFKLISIISLVIALSLSGMIFLATYFFEKDNRIRVQESNHEMSSLLALKVRSDFSGAIEKSKQIAEALLRNRNTGPAGGNDALFKGDRELLFVGIASKKGEGGKYEFLEKADNKTLLDELQIAGEDLASASSDNAAEFLRAFDGDTVIQNVSGRLRVPAVGICFPVQVPGMAAIDSIVVSYMRLESVLKAFRGDEGMSKGFNVFMVNDRGVIIAHPDSATVLSGASYVNLPIVTSMMKSAIDNGQTRYRDEKGVMNLGSFRRIGIGGCGVIATVEEWRALRAVYDIQRRNFYLMVIVLTIVILIIFFYGTSITTPIIRLVWATKKIKAGQYQVDIEPVSRDEIGELTSSFIEMGRGLEEREKMKDAFGKFVNPEIAEQVLKGELKLGGERKNAVVFFSDIRNFTSISEKMQPEEVVVFLNEYMTRMVSCVNNTHGVVDKFIGDAIMAIWGTPISRGNDTENAINGALMMRKELLDFNKDRGGDARPIIKIGCGINSGPVLAGQIGSNDRMEYTVIGDTVNLASRIEALNKPFGTDILISEASCEAVKDIFRLEPMQKIRVKGKDEPVQIFAVLGRIDDESAPKTLQELRALLGIEMEGKPEGEVFNLEEKKYEIVEQ